MEAASADDTVIPGGPFAHGVASGDPTSDRVILWTRLTTDAERPEARWVVAVDPELHDVVAEGVVAAEASADRTAKIDVGGLAPETTYYYAFFFGDERSIVGRTRTLPQDATSIRIAVTSCAKYTAGYFNAYGAIARRDDVDLWLHLGDYIYEYPTDDGKAPGPKIGRPMDPDHECRTLEDYRRRYAHYRRDADVQRLHKSVPVMATLDDHEICNDAWRDGAKNHDEREDGPWRDRKAAALQAWREWMPVRVPDPNDPERTYREFRVGNLAHLVLLDCRTYRDEMTGDRAELDSRGRTMLGKEQWEWLSERLHEDGATWKLIGNGVMMGQVFTDFLPEDLGNPLSEIGILSKAEHGPNPDQWDGYPAERDHLLHAIEDLGRDRVVFVSGDVHSSWAVELSRDPKSHGPPAAVEFVTTSVTSENLDEEMGTQARTESIGIEQRVRDDNPHVRYVELDLHGYMLLDVSHDRIRAGWHYVKELRSPSREVIRGDLWEVRSGSPGLHQVADRDEPDFIDA